MSIITKYEIATKIANTKKLEMNYDFAKEVVSQLDIDNCERHGKDHYMVIYNILKAKVDTLKTTEVKLAYINSAIDNCSGLSNIDGMTTIVSFLLGFAFSSSPKEAIFTQILSVLFALALIALIIYVSECKRYSFTIKVLEQLKDEIEKEEKQNHTGIYIEERHTVRVKLKRR